MTQGAKFWAVIPARGGSKTVPLKNLAPLAGRPLLEYGVRALQAWGGADRAICSTDHERIAECAAQLGLDVDPRPTALAGDNTAVTDVVRELLDRRERGGAALPDWILLVQPTSPFVLPEHFTALSSAIAAHPEAQSAQTVTPILHNHHAWNQRVVDGSYVRFQHAKERRQAYNKQAKPKLFVFGNLVAGRTSALRAGSDFFAEPSLAVAVPRPFDLDVDDRDDFVVAEALLKAGAVQLPHMR